MGTELGLAKVQALYLYHSPATKLLQVVLRIDSLTDGLYIGADTTLDSGLGPRKVPYINGRAKLAAGASSTYTLQIPNPQQAVNSVTLFLSLSNGKNSQTLVVKMPGLE